MDVIELVDLEAPDEHRHVAAEQIHEHAFARLEHRGEHRILSETPAAFEYVQHVSNLRSHGLRAEDRASWPAAICPEMGISATEDVGEPDRSIEQGPNQQRCPFLDSIAFAFLLDMSHDRFRADAAYSADLTVSLDA